MFLNEINAGSNLGTESYKEITTGVAEVQQARSFYDVKLFKKQQIVSVNLQDNIVNSFIHDSNAIKEFIRWTRNIGKFEDFESATNFNDTKWRIEFIAEDISTDDDGPSDFVCSMVFIAKNDDIAFSVAIEKQKNNSILYLINEDELRESLDTSYRTTHEYPFLNGHQAICHSTVSLGMCSYHSGVSENEIFELFNNSLKKWKNESITLGELTNVYETQKTKLSQMKVELKIEDQDTLDSFLNESVSLRTIVAPNNVGMRKLRSEKAMRNDDYNHFSEWYFRDSKIFSCVYKHDSAIVVVNVRSSKVTTRITDLDFHMKELISEIRKRLSDRKKVCKHISINVIINELPDEGTKLDIITIDGYFEKYTLKKNSLRIPVMKYDFSKHIEDYDKYVYEFKGATRDIAPLCDPYNFASFITEIDTDRSHNLNYFIDDMHKKSILDKRGIQHSADEYIEANSQDFSAMLDTPSNDTEEEEVHKEEMYVSGFNKGPSPKVQCAISLIFAHNTVDRRVDLKSIFPVTDNDIETGVVNNTEYQSYITSLKSTADTKIVVMNVSCKKDFTTLATMDCQVEWLETFFSDGMDKLGVKNLIINIIIDKVPPRSMVFDYLTITYAMDSLSSKGISSYPNMRSDITKQSYSSYFSDWNEATAVSGGTTELGVPSELHSYTVDSDVYTFSDVFTDANMNILDIMNETPDDQDFSAMLDAPSESEDEEEEAQNEKKETMYVSDYNEGQSKDIYFAINVIYADSSVNTNGNLFDDFKDAPIETGAFGSGVFNTRLVNIYDKNDTKVVNLHVLCKEKNFSALSWIDEHVEEFETHFSEGVDSSVTNIIIVNVIIDALPPRSIFFENLVVTHGVRTKNKKGKLSSPDMESEITKQSFSSHFKKWNDMIAVSGDGPDLRGPFELTIHTLCPGKYTINNLIFEVIVEIAELSKGKNYEPLK